jgi:hypothetical protein
MFRRNAARSAGGFHTPGAVHSHFMEKMRIFLVVFIHLMGISSLVDFSARKSSQIEFMVDIGSS